VAAKEVSPEKIDLHPSICELPAAHVVGSSAFLGSTVASTPVVDLILSFELNSVAQHIFF
jgi:hypothetical protein